MLDTKRPFPISEIRRDFSFLDQKIYNQPLIYFDTASTAQKPQVVVQAMNDYYGSYCANIHRGNYFLSEQATHHYDQARRIVAQFINASPQEIVFTRNTTESINLVAHALGKILFTSGDEIILTESEHHSNIVPWYLLAKEKGLIIKVAPVFDDGTLDIEGFKRLFTKRTKLAAFTHVSNVLGTINPIKEMVAIAQSFGAKTLIDGAQAAPHLALNIVDVGADFFAFSGHKLYGPTGIGVLFAKSPWLNEMPPFQGGGDMIESVSFDAITFAKGSQKFEAGTQNIAGAIGLGAAISYVQKLDLKDIHNYEQMLFNHLVEGLTNFRQVEIIGTAPNKVALVSFAIRGVHPHDVGSILDRQGIAIRGGHLCAQPLMKRFNHAALSRVSLSFYNTKEEIDRFFISFGKVLKVFKL
jgi:cysteine desulfurase/selenocysteine lyase